MQESLWGVEGKEGEKVVVGAGFECATTIIFVFKLVHIRSLIRIFMQFSRHFSEFWIHTDMNKIEMNCSNNWFYLVYAQN
jgi:hypothetical protein